MRPIGRATEQLTDAAVDRLGYTSPDVDGKHAADQKGGKGIEGDVDRWNIAFDVLQMWRHLQYECGHQVSLPRDCRM